MRVVTKEGLIRVEVSRHSRHIVKNLQEGKEFRVGI